MFLRCSLALLLLVPVLLPRLQAEVPRVWLTHDCGAQDRTVINWETAQPTPTIIHYYVPDPKHPGGPPITEGGIQRIQKQKATTLHHFGTPISRKDTVYHYVIGEGADASPEMTFKSSPSQELRVVVIGDLHAKISDNATAILKDDPHLILSAGDNVPSLHEKGKEGIKIFSALIDSAPELFRCIPFMPVLGNHDKEAHPRGPKPPEEPVYDIDAKAFNEFFPLPGDGWKWAYDFPDFGARFIALDLQHISDFGTTWQTCHDFAPGSEQFEWYKKIMTDSRSRFIFTINNEQNSSMRRQANGEWGKMFRRGSALITGFGSFNERAEWDGFPCFNTHAHGKGTLYKDPNSSFLTPEGGYLLLTFQHGAVTMTLQIKNQKGEVLDTREIKSIYP